MNTAVFTKHSGNITPLYVTRCMSHALCHTQIHTTRPSRHESRGRDTRSSLCPILRSDGSTAVEARGPWTRHMDETHARHTDTYDTAVDADEHMLPAPAQFTGQVCSRTSSRAQLPCLCTSARADGPMSISSGGVLGFSLASPFSPPPSVRVPEEAITTEFSEEHEALEERRPGRWARTLF